MWREVRKQLIDQPLHVLMGVGSVNIIGCLFASLGFPLSIDLTAGIMWTMAWEGLREFYQWPSSRWWDPPLDWTFEVGGIVLGGWLFITHLGPGLF
jgi:hypothetical protein